MILHAVVDNIEENKVSLLISKESSNEEETVVIFPTEFLPPDIGVGDLLKINISLDPQERIKRIKEIEDLWKELGVE